MYAIAMALIVDGVQHFSEVDSRADLDGLPTAPLQGTLDDVPCSHLH